MNSNYLRKYNQPHKALTEEQETEVRILYISGLSCNQIANKYACSKQPILRAIKDLPKRKSTEYKQHHAYTQGYGELHHSWKGGFKDVYNRFRDLSKYYEWRTEVLSRDSTKCAKCNDTKKLHAHHIKTLKSLILEYCETNNKKIKDLQYEDLNSDFFYDLSNGLTLCEICHKLWHKENGR